MQPLTTGLPSLDTMALFESMSGNNVLVQTDAPRFTIVAASEDYLQATGTRREDLLGKGLFEAFPNNPEDPALTSENTVRASLEYALRHKVAHYLPMQRYDIPDGKGGFEVRYWKANNRPVMGPDGVVQYLLHSAEDVTEKIRAEQRESKLREIERSYQLFMHAPVIICIVRGPDHIIELANEGMLKIWDRGPDVVGKSVREVLPELEAQGFVALLDQVRATGETFKAFESPSTLRRGDGSEETLYFNFSYQAIYDHPGDGEASGVIGVAHDVTDQVLSRRKVAEVTERLNFRTALLEAQNIATDDGLLIVDPEGRMLITNPKFAEIWRMPQHILDSADDEAARNHAATLLLQPEGFAQGIVESYRRRERNTELIYFKDGRVIERNGTPVTGADGTYYGWAWAFKDVTERVRQEQRFRNVVEQAPDPILILKGEELVLEVANRALFELWQVGPEAIGKPFLQILPEMKNQPFVDLLKGVLHTGKPFHGNEVPAVFHRQNGTVETRYVNFSYQAYRETDGSISGVLVTATDVTGQVLANRLLQASEENLRSMILQAPVAMCILRGPEYVVEVANDRMDELWGKPEGLVGLPIFEGLPEAREQGLEQLLQQVYDTGVAFHASERPVNLPRQGGIETVYLNFVYEPLRDGANGVSGIIAVGVDVTDQVTARQRSETSEAQIRSLVESAPFPIAVFHGREMRIALANQAVIDVWKKGPDVVGRLYREVLPELESQAVYRQIDEVFTTGRPFHARDQRVDLEVDGERQTFYFNYSFTPLLDAQGNVYGVMNTAADVTDSVRARQGIEEIVAKRTRELQRTNENLEEFAYAASHDMKEPIRKIHFFSDRLKEELSGMLSERQRQLFERLESASRRMGALIDDLLMYSQATRGADSFEAIDLNRKVELVLEDLEVEIGQRRASIEVSPLPVVRGHRRQMQQLFQNLIGNAIKYSKPGEPPRVRIWAEDPEEVEGKLFHRIIVADEGIGFPQSDAERIFNVFTRLHGNAEYRGSGVGLSIVQKVAENHGGRVRASSEPGKGSAFTVWLPV